VYTKFLLCICTTKYLFLSNEDEKIVQYHIYSIRALATRLIEFIGGSKPLPLIDAIFLVMTRITQVFPVQPFVNSCYCNENAAYLVLIPQSSRITQYTSRTALSQSVVSSVLIASLHHMRHASRLSRPFFPGFLTLSTEMRPPGVSRPATTLSRRSGLSSSHQSHH
jgi:hypothetical protein